MRTIVPQFTVAPPEWCMSLWRDTANTRFSSDEEKALLAIELARTNVQQGTGGPFGAAIFDAEGMLVAPGVNQVVPGNASMLHAEVMACLFAQQAVGHFTLRDPSKQLSGYELFASTEPCAMCFGALIWAGIDRLVCSARESDARAVGFEEGPKPADWIAQLEQRYHVAVTNDVCRAQAIEVLELYAAQGSLIYNGATPADSLGTDTGE